MSSRMRTSAAPSLACWRQFQSSLGSFAGVLLVLMGLGCPADRNDESNSSVHRPPDVLVISVDCMRADHVGAYGHGHDTTPAIDAIAQDGILFDRAYAQANWTKPSVASLMSSLYVRNHGVVVGTDYFDDEGVHKVGANSFPLPDDIPLISEAFSSIGYQTAGFVENSHINPAQGFGRGFDVYERVKPATAHLEKWLETLAVEEPFFAYVHLIGPHDPYDGGQGRLFKREYRTRFGEYDSSIDWTDLRYKKKIKQYSEQDLLQARALYDAELNYFDQEQIAPLMAWLKENARYEETLIVVTADHGEELYDHGRWAHGQTLYEEVIRVPLIIKLPKSQAGLRPGSRIDEVVEQIDLFPTLCGLAGCSIPTDIDGRGFEAVLIGDRATNPEAYAITEFGKGVRTQILAASIVHGDTKAVQFYVSSIGPILKGPRAPKKGGAPDVIVMDARSDEILASGERRDQAAIVLRELLEKAIGKSPRIRHPLIRAVGHTEQELDQLRALGYIE